MPRDGNIDETINLEIEYKRFEIALDKDKPFIEAIKELNSELLYQTLKFMLENAPCQFVDGIGEANGFNTIYHLYYQRIKE